MAHAILIRDPASYVMNEVKSSYDRMKHTPIDSVYFVCVCVSVLVVVVPSHLIS